MPFGSTEESISEAFCTRRPCKSNTPCGVCLFCPRINRIEKKILINGQSFSPDEVDFITFEKRVVDGIEDVMASGQKRQTPQGVFDLQGRRVQNASEVDASMLPKGIYVVNGKKMVVK